MKHLSKKLAYTAGLVLATSVTSLFAEQQSSTILTIDMNNTAHSIHYGENGAYAYKQADNVIAVEGAITMPISAPGGGYTIVAPAYGITDIVDGDTIMPGRIFENADWVWRHKFGYIDAIDVSARYNVAYAITRGGEVVKSVDGADFTSAGVPQFWDIPGVVPLRLDVDGAQSPWVVGSDHNLYHIDGGQFVKFDIPTGEAYPNVEYQVSDVGAYAGAVYVVASRAIPQGGDRLYGIDMASGHIFFSDWNLKFKAVDIDELGKVYAVEDRTVTTKTVNTGPGGVQVITTVTQDRFLQRNSDGGWDEVVPGYKAKDLGAQ